MSREQVLAEIQRRGLTPPDNRGAVLAEIKRRGLTVPEAGGAIAGVLEPLATIASGAIAEPIAGLAGIAQAVNPFAEEGAGAKAVEATREALTFQPRTQAGKAGLQAVGEVLQPVGEAISGTEKFLGDAVFKATESPTLAAAAASIPTAILETLGFKGAGRIGKSTKTAEPSQRAIRKSLNEVAPQPERLREIAGGIYDELENAGVKIKSESYFDLLGNIEKSTKRVSKRTTPIGAGLIQDLEDILGSAPTLNELRDFRATAKDIAGTPVQREARIGRIVVQEIDDFLNKLTDKKVIKGTVAADVIGKKLKAADNLWGRARKSELLTETIERAKKRASGFENGIRIEINKIVENKKKSRFFRKSELDAMNDLVKGDTAQNFAKLIGRFGFGEGRASNIIGGVLGTVLGSAAGGTPGVLAAVAVGSASRKIAQKLTKGKADFIETVARAGKDGEAITKAYLNTVPKGKRTVKDLSDLLSDPTIDLTDLIGTSNKAIKEAVEIAAGRQTIGQAVGTIGTAAALPRQQELK